MNQMLTSSAFFGAVISLASFWLGSQIKKRFKPAIFNPILISVLLTIGVLLLLKIDYPTYYSSAKYLSYLLTPTTVCLAIPLYEQLHLLKRNLVAILLGTVSGVLTSLGSIALMGLLLNLSHSEIVTLLPKSVTTAIGLPLAQQMGGYESIAAIVIVLTGVAGNVFAEGFLKLIRVTHPIARGIAIGTCSHSVGTAKAMELGEVEGAMSGLSIAVSGLLTVIFVASFPI